MCATYIFMANGRSKYSYLVMCPHVYTCFLVIVIVLVLFSLNQNQDSSDMSLFKENHLLSQSFLSVWSHAYQ